jgi:hypothetical protein
VVRFIEKMFKKVGKIIINREGLVVTCRRRDEIIIIIIIIFNMTKDSIELNNKKNICQNK